MRLPGHRSAVARSLAVFAAYAGLCFLLAAALEWRAGAFEAEFSGYPDEPSHYVTGLLFDVYARDGAPRHPIAYAEDYYLRYPKVALGHWPPALYVALSTWTLAFGPSRLSVLLLQALLAALTAAVVFAVAKRQDRTAAVVAGAVFLLLHVTRKYTAMVMAENLLALLSLGAAIALGNYLETGRRRHSALFGVFAALAVLTKGSGWALAIAVPIALALSWKLHPQRTAGLWLPALMAGVPCVLWQVWSMGMVRHGWMEGRLSFSYVWRSAGQVLESLPVLFGWGLPLLALAGIWFQVLKPLRAGGAPGIWVSLLAMSAGYVALYLLVPAGIEDRKLGVITPAVVLFAAAGAVGLSACIRSRLPNPLAQPAIVFAAGALVLSCGCFGDYHKPRYGYTDAARFLVQPGFKRADCLVSSAAEGEALLIGELALLDNKPSRYILRGSKLLASVDWSGVDYRPLAGTPEDAMKMIEATPVRLLILDDRPGNPILAHNVLLQRMVRSYPQRWKLLASFTGPDARGSRISVYDLDGLAGRRAGRIAIDLGDKLGRNLAATVGP